MPYRHCLSNVYNRGTPPIDFLDSLVSWAKGADAKIFERNENYDVYSHVFGRLGPWESALHRKAVMLEVLRVLGGFESSWNWSEDVDKTNPNSNTPCTMEAGLFQCSGDSMNFDPSLRSILAVRANNTECDTFRYVTKKDKNFAIEYCARLLRFTVNHHGPLKRTGPRTRSIHPWLRDDAVQEFMELLRN